MYAFKLPDIGEGLSEAELIEWLVKVGDRVSEGDEVATISTDKVNVDLTAPAAGTVTEIRGEPGDVIPVGTLIMKIDDGVDRSREADEAVEARYPAEDETGPATSVPRKTGEEPAQPHRSEAGDAIEARYPSDEVHTRASVRSTDERTDEPIKASPIVRRYAAEHGVDLALVTGSGADGRITRADIDAFLDRTPARQQPGATRFKLSGARLAAAGRLAQSHARQVPSTITFEVPADGMLRRLEAESDTTPPAILAHALCEVLPRHPGFNATVDEADHALILSESVALGIAVDTPQGLMVPVIHDAHKLTASELAAEIARLAEGARRDDLTLDETRGSTFTLSSTGGLERATITAATPVINYPNVATLWASRIRERPRVVDGKLEAGPVMHLSLSFDHRFVHGADAIALINDLAEVLG